METKTSLKSYFLHPGGLFVNRDESVIRTVLGSCISVCLWDQVLKYGGMNHYMLALWNGEGLPSPRYGNIAIPKLIEKMIELGSSTQNIQAKVFGGAAVIRGPGSVLNIGTRNIMLAKDMLEKEGIPIVSSDVDGNSGRKILFNTKTGRVLLKKISKNFE